VGLVPYSEDDAPFFFGREEERDTIIENLRASRLTLLYGTSGVGKSSVLNAGVVYKLRELTQHYVMEADVPEFAVVIFNGWRDDPIPGLMRAVQDAVARALQMKSVEPVPESRNLGEMLKAWTDRYGIELLIILDQFEEYFQYRASEKGEGTFDSEFPQAVNRADLPAKFLISIRDDALSRLDRFRTQIPNLFSNMLRISQMGSEAARKAIEEPIIKYNQLCVTDGEPFGIEPALVDEIIKQIKADPKLSSKAEGTEITTGEEKTVVETTYLQLVMTRLWEKEIEEKSRALRLDTLKRLEGLRNIVQVYLTEAMNVLSEGQQKIAVHALDYFVTASGTKVACIESDLAARLDARYGVDSGDLNTVLVSLTKSRILRPVEPPADRPEESRYEVFHDVLAQSVLKWVEQSETIAELNEAERRRREEENTKRLLLITVLSSLAYKERDEAEKARKEALAQAALARRRLKKIEKLEQELRKRAERAVSRETDPERQQQLARALGVRLPELTDSQKRKIVKAQSKESSTGRSRVRGGDQILMKAWENGKTLHIRFLNGSAKLQKRVEQGANEWTGYANLKFEFDNSPDAEVRIIFKDDATWSYIGTDALAVPQDQPTMDLGALLNDTLSREEFRKYVLHEFGHVLGLIHEHQNPNAEIPWNREYIYGYLTGPPYNWTKAQIDQNLYSKYQGSYRPFDPDSVMAYRMPSEYFLHGFEIRGGTQLSEGDKQIARKMYPPADQ
jgi:hypothetical protein